MVYSTLDIFTGVVVVFCFVFLFVCLFVFVFFVVVFYYSGYELAQYSHEITLCDIVSSRSCT